MPWPMVQQFLAIGLGKGMSKLKLPGQQHPQKMIKTVIFPFQFWQPVFEVPLILNEWTDFDVLGVNHLHFQSSIWYISKIINRIRNSRVMRSRRVNFIMSRTVWCKFEIRPRFWYLILTIFLNPSLENFARYGQIIQGAFFEPNCSFPT